MSMPAPPSRYAMVWQWRDPQRACARPSPSKNVTSTLASRPGLTSYRTSRPPESYSKPQLRSSVPSERSS
jgi:hypothetical protein